MYITVQNLIGAMSEQTLIQLSNDHSSAKEINVTVLDTAIVSACELVDGYLHGRYTLPLSPVPTIINAICIDLARYTLYSRRPEKGLPDAITTSHKNSLKLLESIQTGKLHLGVKGLPDLQPEAGEIKVQSSPKIDLSGY